ncbi:c-type cytochrome [Lentisphaera marina]|uniref:c-type cytochrome n=1 Tax=Lentisphaera marina TaxID=1111041 RepID=UPI00236667EE|nr:c-type cytochrome [Lentisphaera marina]MDD7987134.1 c-type cytochrome [Lentisphaera marina]
MLIEPFKKTLAIALCFTFSIPLLGAPNKGKEIYTKSCLACHAPNGGGIPGPAGGPNLTILKKKYAHQQMHAIMDGKRGGTGSTTMASLLKAMKITKAEMDAALDYALKLPAAPSPHEEMGNAKKGAQIFNQCTHCHGATGMGYQNAGLPAPRLTGQSNAYLYQQLKNFKSGVRNDGSAGSQQMAAVLKPLNDQDLKDLVAYISTLDNSPTPLSDLKYKVYKGSWKKLPDFTKLKPIKGGTITNGLIDLKVAEQKNEFGMVFEGILNVPAKGKYKFHLASDDGAKLYLNDRSKAIVDNDGVHPANEKDSAWVNLPAGKTKVIVDYFDLAGQTKLSLTWSRHKNFEKRAISVDVIGKKKSGPNLKPIVLGAKDGKALVFRNFLNQGNARSIGVSFPGNMNMIFDASNMALASFWSGQFVDIAPMWHGRGVRSIAPVSSNMALLPLDLQFAELANSDDKWPVELNRNSNQRRTHSLRFKGYKLDKNRYPTFMYLLGDITFEDRFDPLPEQAGIKRTIKIKGQSNKLYFRAAIDKITKNEDSYKLPSCIMTITNAELRPFGKVQELLVPVKLASGEAQIQIQYSF